MYVSASSVEGLGEGSLPNRMSTQQKLVYGAGAVAVLGLCVWAFRKSQFSAADIATMALLDALID